MTDWQPYFSSEERRNKLVAACHEREGTPFREGMAEPGKGYDCAPFVRDCFRAAGVDTSAFDDCPRVSLRYGKFHDKSIFIEWLHARGGAAHGLKLQPGDELGEFICGDILVIKDAHAHAAHHLALAEGGGYAWHVPMGIGVTRVPIGFFRNAKYNCVSAVFRLMEEQYVVQQ